MSTPTHQNKPVRWGAYIALAFALIFFSGAMKGTGWHGVFDFTTLNGTFGKLVSGVKQTGDAITTSTSTLRGAGGDGAMEGFLFAFGLIPTVMFALGVINVLEHYGALDAARKLLSPLLRPLMGVSGNTGMALIGSLQSTDVGASLTRVLADDKQITEREKDVFTMFQFSAGAMLVNFFSSGAVLFTLVGSDGNLAVPASIGTCVAVMFVMKIVGANLFRIYLKATEGKGDAESDNTKSAQTNA